MTTMIIDNIDNTIFYDTLVFDGPLAQKFLDERGFENNRPLRNGKVDLLAAKMESGRYKDNGTPSISVAKDGKMRNGHHTLAAVAKSECTVRLRIAWNVPNDTYETFDTGALRSPADILASTGHTNVHALAAILRPIIRWERGFRSAILFSSDAAAKDPIMPSDYEDAISVMGTEIRAAISFAHANKGSVSGSRDGRIRTQTRAMFNPTALGVAYYILSSKPGGPEYLAAMTSGANLTHGSPALAVRSFFTTQNPLGITALTTILRGFRRTVDGLTWNRVDASKFVDNSKLWEV